MGWAPVRRVILGRRKDTSYSEIKVEVLTRTAFVSDHVCVWICVWCVCKCVVCELKCVLVCVLYQSYNVSDSYIMISILLVIGDKLMCPDWNEGGWRTSGEPCKLKRLLSQTGDNCRLGAERLLSSVTHALVKNQITHFTAKIALGSSFAFSNCLEFSNTSKIYNLKRILWLLFPLKGLIRCNLDLAPKFWLMW